ncbi:LysR family transcriptional regulator [Clostridium sp. WILCCON 0269]|uniref:LysR family transcriptional regulator n=1 Tax=Candidatus Clostridium eludens TaxID=3381663 RepID=A0ABW8SGX8_9CLOT
MDIKQLQTFIIVSKLLNFREAGEELNYSQSSVSDHIRNLEQELGVKLFERLGRKVFLNENGKKLISPAEKMIQYEKEIHQLFNKDEKISGLLRIGAAETLSVFWLPPILKEYRITYPDVKVTLRMADCCEFPKMLSHNMIDVAFSLHDQSQHDYISQINIFEDSTVFIVAPDHPLADLKTITIHELENHSFILPEAECCYRVELEELLKKCNVKIDTIMEFSSLEAIKQCVKSGLGISLLPKIAVEEEINTGELDTLSIEDCEISICAKMICHKQKWTSPPLAALKNMILQKKITPERQTV